jgi:hypothetical protein
MSLSAPVPGTAGIRSWLARLAAALGWLAAVAVVLANKAVELVFNNAIPGRDSGVFVTIAQGILRGEIPYRDFWDHKAPGIYYIDALIFRLLPPWPSSLHIAEAAVALLGLVLFYRLLRSFAARPWSLLGLILFALFSTHPYTNEGGNFTETYALLPVIVTYLFLLGCLVVGPRLSWLFGSGVAIAVATLVRPQEALHLGPALVVALVAWPPAAFASRVPAGAVQRFARRAFALALGFGIVLAPVLTYFAAAGAWSHLVEQVIHYNRLYSATVPAGAGLSSLLNTLRTFPAHPFLLLNAGIAGFGALALGRSRGGRVREGAEPHRARPALLLAAWLLLEFAALALGGRYYNHYFLVIVPPAVALLVWGLSRLFAAPSATSAPRSLACGLGVLLLVEILVGTAALYARDILPWQARFLPLVALTPANPAVVPGTLAHVASVDAGRSVHRAAARPLASRRRPPTTLGRGARRRLGRGQY